MIYSGPHIGVANPLFKTSRRICRLNSDYDNIDLTNTVCIIEYINEDYNIVSSLVTSGKSRWTVGDGDAYIKQSRKLKRT